MGRSRTPISVAPSTRVARVIVADPYPVIVLGVRKMVEDDPRLQVVAEVSTMPSLWEKVIAEGPDVALVDWSMASQELAATTAMLRSDLHSTSVVFLTGSENAPEKQEIMWLGACGVLSKWTSAQELQTAVWTACKGRIGLDSAAAEGGLEGRVATPSGTDAKLRILQLTRRERQLVPLVCSGLRNKEIAQQLGIAESTVWHHLTSVFTKLQVEDRMGLAAFAYSHRLVLPAVQGLPAPRLGAVEAFPT
jgi:DNA-binding NarL/FixJ family response regulator